MLYILLTGLLVVYLIYTRFYRVYSKIYIYSRQGIPFQPTACLPFIGSFASIIHFAIRYKPVIHPFIAWNKHTYLPDENASLKAPSFTGIILGT